MTTSEPGHPHQPTESADAREARMAVEEYLRRTGMSGRPDDPGRSGLSTGAGDQGPAVPSAGGRGSTADAATGTESPAPHTGAPIDDRVADAVAREAWDAVTAATPPPPSPVEGGTPGEGRDGAAAEPAEVAELRRRATAIARGLRELGCRLDDTLLPGPDMAAG
ncbi:hypothetical protein [Streptomyces sp. NPDC008121]|uniref:hypothetical protein n=1 Tax=Streptomyces sp. NPDC008121 TaxID=3364809 RepID=UPI0036E40348